MASIHRKATFTLQLLVVFLLTLSVANGDEGAVEKRPKKGEKKEKVVVLSFSRYESRLSQICVEMEIDGRRERLATIADGEARSHESCQSCRALWKSIDRSCRKPAKKLDRKKQKGATKKGGAEEGAEPATEEEVIVPPTPTVVVRQRHPSPAVLDQVSRLSTSLYQADEGGGVYGAVDYVRNVVLATKDLTPAERDYFEILMTYLLASWAGRTELEPRATPKPQELDDLFH